MDQTPRRASGRNIAAPHCGQRQAPPVGAAAHIAARVAATHLDASGKAAIAHHWAELKARRKDLRLQADFERRMRAVLLGAMYGRRGTCVATGNAWVDPVIHAGDRA